MRKRGGAGVVRDERAARRVAAGWSERAWRERYASLGPVPSDPDDAHVWSARVTLLAMAEAAADPGPPPEVRREQIARIASVLAKILDPAKLASKLGQYEEAIEQLESAAPRVNS